MTPSDPEPNGRGSTIAAIATEDETTVLKAHDEAVVGRDPSSTIRIGHAPVYDDVVPRRACGIFSFRGRVLVSNLSSRLAFDVVVDDRPPMVVRAGDWFSPPHHRFDIVITGGAFSYALTVTVNSVGARAELATTEAELADSEPLTGAVPQLTDRQRDILDAYTEPVRDGRGPASHQEVADRIGISRSLVRLECNRIWSELLLTGVPMRDLPDMRDAIVDAWTRHRF